MNVLALLTTVYGQRIEAGDIALQCRFVRPTRIW